ncbi:MAG: VWA domain-containing protein [Gammaproteobacteria bacterium]|nr:VWA domain-containing protein [Gammaproteobacteria bacterium]
MDSCHLLRIEALWLLIPLALLLWLFARRTRSSTWQRVCDSRLLPFILQQQNSKNSLWPLGLVALGGLLAILALAGPSCEKIEQPVFRDQSALVIALDLSRSMDAADVAPSRLQRARLKLIDILNARREGQTALIVYAADAYTVSPLTDDTHTIIAQVNSLETELMPQQGSRPDIAVAKASELLQQAGVVRGDILLITDGVQKSQLQPTLTQLTKQAHALSVLAVGTAAGAPIKLSNGGFVQNSRGEIVIPKLDEHPLRQLASQGNGRYQRLSADDSDIQQLAAGFHQPSQANNELPEKMRADLWREDGPWLLLPLLLIAPLVFRRGYLALVLVVLLPPPPVQASALSDLFLNNNQRAEKQLQQGQAEQAAKTFTDPQWQATAHYRAGHYPQAAKLLEGIDNADAQYNRGNALAKMRQYEQAIAAYDRALQLNPQHQDAKFNRDLVKKQHQKQSQDNNDKGDKGDKGDQQDKADQNQSQNADAGAQKNKQDQAGNASPDNAKPSADAKQNNRDQNNPAQNQQEKNAKAPQDDKATLADDRQPKEQDIATEQWLRRIPDDPGGLLRRKFLYQYQQQSTDQPQEQETW